MADFDIRGDSIDVQDVMDQIRARLRDKRGVDYTEQQIRELAAVKLETFLDARTLRSDLLAQFRATRPSQLFVPFGPDPLFTAHRPIVARIRALLRPVLRFFFNPDPINEAFQRINLMADIAIAERDQYFELLHNLVLELTRTTIEVRNLKMRVESLSSRLDFDERRARALESRVVYRTRATESRDDRPDEGPGLRSRRLMARRWRRGRPPAASVMGSPAASATNEPPATTSPQSASSTTPDHDQTAQHDGKPSPRDSDR
jgi:hypothetical protein